jgi:phage tail protein X
MNPITMPPRIYADFNGYRRGDTLDWIELDTFGTLVDLHHHQISLREGLEIVAWDQSDEVEDMEVTGNCHYIADKHRPHWCVRFPVGSLVYVAGRGEALLRDFVCFRCRHKISETARSPGQQTCLSCGLSIHFPWLAPTPTTLST